MHSRLVDVDENLRADRTDEDEERLISVANPIDVAVYFEAITQPPRLEA